MIAAAESRKKNTSHVMSVAKFERFLRIAAWLNVDKQDLKRYSDFINRKVYDLLDHIRAADNIEVLTHTEIVALYGSREEQLERVRWRNNVTARKPRSRSVTSFSLSARIRQRAGLGATGSLDPKNFVLTGSDVTSDVPPVEQRIRPSSVAGNQRSRRVHRRRRAVRISQAGRRRNRRGAVVGTELHTVLANGAAASARRR
jgi:thioredoxin reductase (NADPH)